MLRFLKTYVEYHAKNTLPLTSAKLPRSLSYPLIRLSFPLPSVTLPNVHYTLQASYPIPNLFSFSREFLTVLLRILPTLLSLEIYLSIIVPSLPHVLKEKISILGWFLHLFFKSYLLSITQGLYILNDLFFPASSTSSQLDPFFSIT